MIQEIEEFSIYGVSVKTDEELESDLNSSLIFPLWKNFIASLVRPMKFIACIMIIKTLTS